MNLSKIFVVRPVATSMIFIAVCLLGFVSLNRLSVDFLPDIKVPSVTIKTVYPDASPQEIEKSVSEPIESRISTLSGVKKTSSISKEGLSLVTVNFNWNVDMDYALLEIREKLDQLRPMMPEGAKRSTVLGIDPTSETMMTIAITSNDSAALKYSGLSETEKLTMMKNYAESIVKRRLEQIEGVALAAISGGIEREIFIELDKEMMELYGLSISDVSKAISSSNVSIPGGNIKQGYFKLSLKAMGEFTSLNDIERSVVKKNANGGIILLSDIARVVEGYEERTGITKLNNDETIGLLVYKEADANTVETSKKVQQVISEINSGNPNLRAAIVFDQAEFISKSLDDVKDAIFQGAILAFIILFLFLKEFRNPVIIGITMPISILITFILMDLFGVSINIISLTGLALGIGMLGDNAIVIIENAARLRESGFSRRDAAITGGNELNLPAAMSTFTNVAIFLPVLYVEGVAKELFKDMALTMTFSLLASLISAIVLVPMLVSREKFYRNVFIEKVLKKLFALLNILINFLRLNKVFAVLKFDLFWQKFIVWYERKLDGMIGKRREIILVSLAIFIISIIVARSIPTQSTPEIDRQRFSLELELPKGSSLEAVENYTSIISEMLMKTEGVELTFSRAGIVEEQSVSTSINSSKEKSVIDVKIKDENATAGALTKARAGMEEFMKNAPDINISLKRAQTTFEQILRPEPYDIKIMVEGKEFGSMIEYADSIQSSLKGIAGITDVRGGMQKGNPEIKVIIDKEKCLRYNIPLTAISESINLLSKGLVVSEYNDFDRKRNIRMLLSEKTSDISNIMNYRIETVSGSFPLSEFITAERTAGYSEIWRENQNRVVMITANLEGITNSEGIERIEKVLSGLSAPGECNVRIGGENEEIKDSFNSLFIILILSLLFVYILLAMEFESLKVPFVVILTSPLAFIGAISAMVIFGESYNLMSMIGIVIMIGAVDNDAVIAVDFIIHQRNQGVPLKEAVKTGMVKRLRSIIMTTATSVIGLVPLILMSGESSSIAKSLSYPVAGGLITSTLFTLIVIPVVYTYIDRRKD